MIPDSNLKEKGGEKDEKREKFKDTWKGVLILEWHQKGPDKGHDEKMPQVKELKRLTLQVCNAKS